MTTTRKPEILHAFFCEFLRAEMSGQMTAIGLWGETVRISVPPPIILPSLCFHANIRNLGHLAFNAKVRITLPGGDPPIEVTAPVKSDPTQESQFLNVNMATMQIKQAGEVVGLVATSPPPHRPSWFSCRNKLNTDL